jgi:hypothetical protein
MTDSPDPAAAQAELASALDFAPVPRRFNRGDVWTEEVQRAFIETLADCGSVEAACRAVGRSPASAYRLRRHALGAGFAAAWQAAVDFGIRRIEDYAMDRATNGVEVPVFAYGDKIATRRVYNDQLTMFMLRSRLPERYCDGGARALNAIDKRVLARLKKQWREEWEEEQRANQPDIEDIRAEIRRKVAALEQAGRRRETPRERELREAYEAERAARLAREEDEKRRRLRAMSPEWRSRELEQPGEPADCPSGADSSLDLARAQMLGAVEARVRQLEAREGEGPEPPAATDLASPNDPPPFTGEGDHEAQRSGGGGQSADPEQAPSGSLRSPPPP